ncbi:Rad52/Rad22 family DNA repair protein [Streptomyces albogriseolus]|uniref:Rad52/Rad22 family DNA repair protein n=1 Tax=Streptomyces albogriseolus TaxID=1887 RepID=UPI00345F8F29
MASAVEAPATVAEGQTSHTLNQAARLSPYQLRMLHGGINPNRVRNLRGLAHLEAWDVRRQLIRIFGFGGFSIETLALDLVHNHGQEGFRRKNKQGEFYGDPFTAWTVVYRAQVRLTVFDTSGREICHWEDGAAGDAVNQPSVGDAHDMAMKTAFSQALKRCAVNLGDQFGLSLYNDGSRDAVVGFSAAHPPQEWKQQPAPLPEPDDPPVKPEPGMPAPDADEEPSTSPAAEAEPVERPAAAPSERLGVLLRQVADCWNSRNLLVFNQIGEDAAQHGVLDEQFTDKRGVVTTLRKVLDDRIAEIQAQGGDAGRDAA